MQSNSANGLKLLDNGATAVADTTADTTADAPRDRSPSKGVSQGASPLAVLVYDSADLCAVLRISEATLHRLKAAGKLPKPLRLGGQLRWEAEAVRRWVTAGMPDRRAWEAMEQARLAAG